MKVRPWGHAGLVSIIFFGLLGTCTLPFRETETLRRLTILYTNDEHGWMTPYQGKGGANGMLRAWERSEGYRRDDPDGRHLVLSGGDMLTGPAISTYFNGQSMIEIMNYMGYDAAAIGNHDFDFGLQPLRARAEQAAFPLLSANVVDRQTGAVPDFAHPFAVTRVNGIQVAIIGLTTVETSVDTRPAYVAGYRFRDYPSALERIMPDISQLGVDLILVVGHICSSESEKLAPVAAQFGIAFIGGGHCHEVIDREVAGVKLVESGHFMQGYQRIEMLVDVQANAVVKMEARYIPVRPYAGDTQLQALISEWQARLPADLVEPIGYTDTTIDRNSPVMAELIMGSWLKTWPQADVAIGSARYVQQGIPPGEISHATVIGVLPTMNVLFQIELTGEQLMQVLAARRPMTAGLLVDGDVYRLSDGRLIEPDREYAVLIPDSLYEGGNYYTVRELDPTPLNTGIDWRAPVVDRLITTASTITRPLTGILLP
jgi:5'-nucleotidase / UDP-sugar diphosphatase